MEILKSDYVYVILYIPNVILHALGFYLLIHTYEGRSKTIQHTYLINLSFDHEHIVSIASRHPYFPDVIHF